MPAFETKKQADSDKERNRLIWKREKSAEREEQADLEMRGIGGR